MKTNEVITRFTNFLIRGKWFVFPAVLGLAFLIAFGGQFIKFNNDYHVFFGPDNPQLKAFDALHDKYTQDDNVFIVIKPKDNKVFTKETLSALEEITEQSWQTPYSTRVDAITNFQHIYSKGDDMYVEDLATDIKSKSAAEIAKIKDIAVNETLLKNRIIDEEGTVTAVNITVRLPGKDMNENGEIMAFVRDMTTKFEKKYPNLKTYLSGNIMLNGAFTEGSQNDMSKLVPLMFVVIILTVFFVTRNVGGTIATFIVMILSIVTAMGFAGWAGIDLTAPSSSAPIMIVTLAIADSIHILVTMLQFMRKGHSKYESIAESMRINFTPVLVTSLTTVIGFLTLNFSDSPPFHDLGNITAIGVLAAFAYSTILLPVMIAIFPVKVKVRNNDEVRTVVFLDRIADFVIGNHKRVLWGTTFAVLLTTAFIMKNELNNEFIKFFDEDITFRKDTDFISENLTGIYNIEYSLNSGEEDGISDPAYLRKMEEFENWFKTQDHVIHVNAFSEVMRRVNKSMHGDSLQYFRIPDSKQEAAQYLLLYEMSLPYGLDLNNQINVDKSETRFTVTVENVSTSELLAMTEKAEGWLRANAPEEMFSYGISMALMFSHITMRNMVSMLDGGIVAIILISFILIFALRNLKIGALSLIPNLAPIAVGFGIWGIFNGQINMGLAVVLGMTLGIVVDDTVHILSKYLRARKEMRQSAEDAVRYAFSTVGQAVIVTTIVLVAGFSILAQSSFGFNSQMAKLTALVIVIALVLDLLMLPALLLTIDKSKSDNKEEELKENLVESN